MRLRLSVTSEERTALGHRARQEFDANGGVIGRNANCTWSLPDPTNTVSARHATISHNGRGFLITDTSTNGVYLNTVDAPIGRGATAALTHGDMLYLGHFVISVEIVDGPEDARRRVGAASTATPMIGGETAWPIGGLPRPAAPSPLRAPTLYPSTPSVGTPPPNVAGGLGDLLSPDPSLARSRPALRPQPPTIPPADFAPPRTTLPPSFERAAPPSSTVPPSAPQATIPSIDFASPPRSALPSSFESAAPLPTAPPLGGGPPPRVETSLARPAIPADVFPDVSPAPAPSTQVAAPKASNPPQAINPPAAPVVAKAPLIPDIFDFSDLMRPNAAASPAPSSPAPMSAPEAPAAVVAASIAPAASAAAPPSAAVPLSALPVDFSDLSPAANAPPAKAPVTAPPTERAPLRAAASLAPDAAPVLLDPVAVLRQRADDYSNAARQAPPEPPPLPPRAPMAAPVGPAEQAVPRMSPVASPATPRAAAIPLAQPPGGAPAASSRNAAVATFCEGLGLDPAEIPPHVLTQTLLEFGRTLRVAVDGMMPVLAARRSLKGELHMDQTRLQPRENNPLKFLSSGDEVLRAALKPDASGFLSLSEALREGFNDIRAHEVAAIVALQGAVKAVLERFDPAALEGSAGGGKFFGRGPDKAKLWDQFVARYAAIAGDPDETIRQIVGGEFARAYAQQTQAEAQGRS